MRKVFGVAAAAVLATGLAGPAASAEVPSLPQGSAYVASGCTLYDYAVCAFFEKDQKGPAIGVLYGADDVKLAGRYTIGSILARGGFAFAEGPTNGAGLAMCMAYSDHTKVIKVNGIGQIAVLGRFKSSLTDPDRGWSIGVQCATGKADPDTGLITQEDRSDD